MIDVGSDPRAPKIHKVDWNHSFSYGLVSSMCIFFYHRCRSSNRASFISWMCVHLTQYIVWRQAMLWYPQWEMLNAKPKALSSLSTPTNGLLKVTWFKSNQLNWMEMNRYYYICFVMLLRFVEWNVSSFRLRLLVSASSECYDFYRMGCSISIFQRILTGRCQPR